MAKIATYTSFNVKLTWADHTFLGLAPNGLEITPSSDITDEEVGMDKSVQVSMLPDDTGTITVRLQQNSPSNQFLGKVLSEQRRTGELVISNFTMFDPSGSIVTVANDAHVKTKPTISRGNTATGTTMDWVFYSPELLYKDVAPLSETASTIVEDVLAAAADSIAEYINS